MSKITTATDEQWSEVEQCRLRWLNEEQTAQYPIADIRAEVLATFDRMKMQHPIAVWVVDSPIAAQMISAITQSADANLRSNLHANLRSNLSANLYANLSANLHDNLYDNLYANLHDNLYDNLYANLYDNLYANLHDNLSDLHANLRSNLYANLRSNLHANLYDNLYANLRSNLHANLRSNLYANLRSNLHDNLYANLHANLHDNLHVYCGIWWNAWAGWHEGGQILGVPEHANYQTFQRWNRYCPVWMWDDSQVFILKRPTAIHWGDSGLHNDTGPAVEYSPIWSLWFVEGVMVDSQIVTAPETQTLEQIRGEENAEVKRIRIERFGWDRYLTETNATVVDQGHNEIEQTHEALMQCDNMRVFVGACPSTARVYSLEVPPEVDTCEQARCWLANDNDLRTVGAT